MVIHEKIKFSVLIPVYNVENYLKECICSVLNQTYKNFEIVLINDGSTDMSGKICDEFSEKDKRVKVYHQDNQGLLMARRNGIAKATGDFCLFLDSDDYWDHDLLENVYNIVCEYNCDLVIFKYRRVTETGLFIQEQEGVFPNKTIFDKDKKEKIFLRMLDSSDLNNLVCKAAKSSIIDHDFDYSRYGKLNNAEDLLQSIPLIYNAEKIVYMDQSMYHYRTTDHSVSRKFNVSYLRDISIAREMLLEYLRKSELDDENNLKRFFNFYEGTVLSYISDLINSDLGKSEKQNLLNGIKKIQLYIDSLKYIDVSKIRFYQKPIYYLFIKNKYQLLFVYAKIIDFLIKSSSTFRSRFKNKNIANI